MEDVQERPRQRNTEDLTKIQVTREGPGLNVILTDKEERETTATPPAPSPKKKPGDWYPFIWISLVCALALVLGFLASLELNWPFATVTITPSTQHVSAQKTVIIPGRTLAQVTMSQAVALPVTGKGHQEARAATGVITFYNASLTAVTIPSGTVLTGTDGVEVATDQDAAIPAAAYPTFGSASVSAHATRMGPQGNIKAGDLYGPCCRTAVSVVNGAFSGGQIAREYQMVTQEDIDQAEYTINAGLHQSTQAAIQGQVRSDETLVTPVMCSARTTSDHQAGEEATEVTVTIVESCTGEVYQTEAMNTLVTQLLDQNTPNHYKPMAVIQADAKPTGKQFTLSVTGNYEYAFTQAELDRMAQRVAGKTEDQAKDLLLRAPGVQRVVLSGGEGIPYDPAKIHFIIN